MAVIASEYLLTSFRFHTGTIKTYAQKDVLCSIRLFRFHTGTIKTSIPATKKIILVAGSTRFDSTLVRLKPLYSVKCLDGSARFDSTLVRLKLG